MKLYASLFLMGLSWLMLLLGTTYELYKMMCLSVVVAALSGYLILKHHREWQRNNE